jgi:hypothetical protein
MDVPTESPHVRVCGDGFPQKTQRLDLPQMLRRYGASARSARARRSYDRIMDNTT